MDCVNVLMVNLFPEFLKGCLIKVGFVQLVIADFGCIAVFYHAIQGDGFVEYGLYQLMDVIGHWGNGRLFDGFQCSIFYSCFVSVGNVTLVVAVSVIHEISLNVSGLTCCNRMSLTIVGNCSAGKECFVGFCGSCSQNILGFCLKACDKVLIAFVGDNGELVHVDRKSTRLNSSTRSSRMPS